MNKISFTKNYKIALCVPAAIIVICLLLSLFGLGMNMGIDFTGGALLTYNMGGEYNMDEINAAIAEAGITEAQTARTGDGSELQIRLKSEMSDEEHRTALTDAIAARFENAEFVKQDFVGAIAGRDLISNAIKSVLIVALCMLIYIWFRFDWRSGLSAVFALLHDVVMMMCGMVLFRWLYQVNSSFIAAALTIVGYSINNTIIIFDRIRENQHKGEYSGKSRMELVEGSVRQTIVRSLNTAITTLITIVLLFALGGTSIREFAFPIIVGNIAGLYSSVLLAGQTWAFIMDNNLFSRKANKGKGAKKANASKA